MLKKKKGKARGRGGRTNHASHQAQQPNKGHAFGCCTEGLVPRVACTGVKRPCAESDEGGFLGEGPRGRPSEPWLVACPNPRPGGLTSCVCRGETPPCKDAKWGLLWYMFPLGFHVVVVVGDARCQAALRRVFLCRPIPGPPRFLFPRRRGDASIPFLPPPPPNPFWARAHRPGTLLKPKMPSHTESIHPPIHRRVRRA